MDDKIKHQLMFFVGLIFFVFLILTTKYMKSHVLQFITLRIIAKVYHKQKIFTSEKVNGNDNTLLSKQTPINV